MERFLNSHFCLALYPRDWRCISERLQEMPTWVFITDTIV